MSPHAHATIRPARLGDADDVWPLARDFATTFTPERQAFERSWQHLVAADDTMLLVADDDQRIVGYLLGNSHLTFLANGPVTWVEEVMVAVDRRREGIGRDLIPAAEERATRMGAGYISLASRRSGPFYTALGYDDSAVFYKKNLA